MKKKSGAINAYSAIARKAFYFLFLFTMIGSFSIAQQRVIQLYKGAAPGSENWNWEEKESTNPMKMRIAYNVAKPTLTVFSPDSPNGTAVILCPGGGFQVLNFEHEGINPAKELNKKGITVFLLKYRVVHSLTEDPWQEMMSNMKDSARYQQEIEIVTKMAMEDANMAIAYVRKYASEFKIDTKKIGIIGFSAGGFLALNIACNDSTETKADFAGIMYAGIAPFQKITIPRVAPPLFIAAATDDILWPVSYNIDLYNLWIGAKQSAELHLYVKGGHGLRFAPGNSWIYRFEEWLNAQGF